jgi:large subunit ribosomal protein L2
MLYQSNKLENSYGILRSIEYDPNRSTHIGLLQHKDGSFCYITVSSVMKINDVISFSNNYYSNYKIGDFVKLRFIPVGIPIFNIEKYPGSGATYVKAAGTSAKIIFKDVKYCKIRLSSGIERIFDLDCIANLGISSNSSNKFNKKYKAGTNRLLNKRPTVRGTAMNPIDHPHGGGQNKSTPGRPSVSP